MLDTAMPYPMRTAAEKRTAYLVRYSQLQAERSDWLTHWAQLAQYLLPRAPRFFASDHNRAGAHKYGWILDNTGTMSVRVLSAGMMAGMTSPARPWFKLTVPDPDLNESHTVRMWLDDVVERMQRVFARSNIYRTLQRMYEDLGVFGTSAALVLSDFDSVVHTYKLSIGEYCLAQDWQGRITTCYREFERTVAELVKEFGLENCSEATQQSWHSRNHDRKVRVLHVVEPRVEQDRKTDSPAARDMPWTSVYLEIAGNADRLLRESGFKRMRVIAPRWQTSGADVYGISPGMDALGDVKQLQQEQMRKSQAIDYKTKPPLQVPQSVRSRMADILPGGVGFYEPGAMIPFDQNTSHGGVRNAFVVDLDLPALLEDLRDVRERIKRAFHEDMFLMLAMLDDKRMTATEVLERQEEKLLMVGPVVERLTNEALEPLITITFHDMLDQGLIPPPPEEMAGSEINVEFVSILAQAQRAVGITATQQWVNDLLVVAQQKPEVLDVLDVDEWARGTAHQRGVEESILVDEGLVQELRAARAKAQAAVEQAQAMNMQADTAQKLSAAPVDQNTALDEALRTVTGTPVEGAV